MLPSSLQRLYEDLDQWVASAHHTLLASDRLSADDIKGRIITVAVDSLRSAARTLDANERNTFIQLGPAVLGRILADPLLASDVVAVSHTCRRLRSMIVDCPQYWNRPTDLNHGANLVFERFVMQRSQPTPLDLYVSIWGWGESRKSAETSCHLVKENMHRLCRLALIMERPPATWRPGQLGEPIYVLQDFDAPDEDRSAARESWILMRDALETPAPLLRELNLGRDSFGTGSHRVLPVDSFCGQAPLLRTCTLKGITLPPQCIQAFSNLVTLHYHSFQPQVAELDLLSFGKILDGLQLLQELSLRGHWFSLGDGATESSPSQLRTVRVFDVPLPFEIARDLRSRSLELPDVHDFFYKRCARRFVCTSYDGVPGAFNSSANVLQIFPSVESMLVLLPHIELRSGPSTLVVLRAFWDVEHFSTQPRLHAHLKHLTIHEHFWPGEAALPEAPRLETLCIVLGAFSEYQVFHRAFGNHTCSLSQAGHAWTCPTLHTMTLAYPPPRRRRRSPSMRPVHGESFNVSSPFRCKRPDGDTLPVSLREIHRFISTCLRFSRAQLALLQLSGVEPIDMDARGLLHVLADDVRISATVDDALVDRIAWDWCAEN
ncbi:hypothetical protein AURDEDRAFT_154212 [Auricularia subglabra TFB-10046 SS5]|uniref:F-box domain-containing protein n=1 Tax=Auricularia subglabra (strain TFB-10046 / SS5) TaxID=717982 RepID=J0DBJ7_AURST|nr:hypothetical protein AURDEDRAFT_154212 [Auricularia subglabra TFB-10046 SS5]